ncbi:MAG TPA: hypothetical protein DCO79_05825 [Spirochaeta sp.]|nr:hypothetical protein [Spirochaeta sp.]
MSLSSCLDAIQHITINSKGDIELSFMLTISKSLFAMGGSQGESLEDSFTEDVIDPDELSAMIPQATKVDARLIDSDVDYGYHFKFTIPRNFQPQDDTPMVPRINWDNIEILLGMPTPEAEKGETAEPGPTDEMDEMGEAIFSSAKYKVQISKKLLEQASKAYVRTASGEITNVDLVDLGDTYLVNLPMLMIMGNEEETYLVFEY